MIMGFKIVKGRIMSDIHFERAQTPSGDTVEKKRGVGKPMDATRGEARLSFGAFSRGNFSLIELLVMIAIVAILSTLLLPALSRAKEMSQVITCLNNARQCHLGVAAYAGDFNGLAPFYKPWHSTASEANSLYFPVQLSYGDQRPSYIYFRARQMIENGYWTPGHLQCPKRDSFDSDGRCFAAREYYKKKRVLFQGSDVSLFSSYAVKGCSLENWASGNQATATANLSYRFGSVPGETLIVDYDYVRRMFHPPKYILVYMRTARGRRSESKR